MNALKYRRVRVAGQVVTAVCAVLLLIIMNTGAARWPLFDGAASWLVGVGVISMFAALVFALLERAARRDSK